MAKRVSFSAVATALTVIFLYAASAFSVGKLAALGLSSLFCAICICSFGVRYGVAQYLASAILSLLLIPNKLFVIIYIVFAGYYPVVKLYIEKLNKLWAEWLLKFLFFNLILLLIYYLANVFFLPSMDSAVVMLLVKYLALVIVGLEIVFVLYDWILSYMISYYHQYLRRIFRV